MRQDFGIPAPVFSRGWFSLARFLILGENGIIYFDDNPMEKPFITIITCTKNSGRFLEECLDSVSGQTYKNFEHVLVDGFSKDKTMEIIGNYIRRNPDITVKVIRSEPRGIANAMNIGIKNSRGDILHFLHSDDYYYSSDSLERAAKIFESKPEVSAIIGKEARRVGDRILVLGKNNPVGIVIRFMNKFSHPNTFFRRMIFDKYGLFDETFRIAMDLDHFYKWRKKEKSLFVDESFTVFRHHQGSISGGLGANKLIVLKEGFRLTYKKAIERAYDG